MTKTSTPGLVLLAELAWHLGNGTEDYARGRVAAAGFDIVLDWAGRPAVHAEEARTLVDQYNAEYQARAERLSRYEVYRTERNRERMEAGRKAYEAAARRKLFPRAARDAQIEALGKFDKKNPEGSFEEFE